MSLILEDLELTEVDLSKSDSTPRIPDPVKLPPESPPAAGGVGGHRQHGLGGDHTHDIIVSPKVSNTSELSQSASEKTKKSLKERVVHSVRRVAQTLGIHVALKDKTVTLDDDSSFDGHLFEYAKHVQTEPRVIVPRLHLKATCRERAVSLVRRIFLGCARSKPSYGYESSSE